MPREYRHIEQYEKEIWALRLIKREIGEKCGFTKEQIKGVLRRKGRREEKLSYGILPKKRGRQPKQQAAQGNTTAELQ